MKDVIPLPKDSNLLPDISPRLPSLDETHNHLFSDRLSTVNRLASMGNCQSDDEVLVVDGRSDMSPAQIVENKLIRNLRGNPMPVRYLLNKANR